MNYEELSMSEILWKKTKVPGKFSAYVNNETYFLNINPGFPFEDAYSIRSAKSIIHFNIWPTEWIISKD